MSFAYQKKYRNGKKPWEKVQRANITKEFIEEARVEFFKNGGVVTKITDKEIQSRRIEELDFVDGTEVYEFLNGE